ncbi:MAG TPA: hypothetical protein VHW65_12070 [Gemmatimonadales bacterium]|jgi:hypothetical protein|nr:hypothetical protein [Gemmatimonadales bacterium]
MQVRMSSWLTAALLAAPLVRVSAQAPPDLKLGVWRGWIMQEGQDSVRAQFDVEADKKHLYVTMRTRGSADYGMAGVKLKNDVLTFEWYVGAGGDLYCRLSRHGGVGFDGDCIDRRPGPTGQPVKVWMNMMPPRDSGR